MAWRQVAGSALAGVAQAHGNDGEQFGVVELLRRDAQPPTEPLTARVVERNACRVHLAPRCLGGHEDAGGRMQLKDRPWPKGQVLGAQGAGLHLSKERSDGRHGGPL